MDLWRLQIHKINTLSLCNPWNNKLYGGLRPQHRDFPLFRKFQICPRTTPSSPFWISEISVWRLVWWKTGKICEKMPVRVDITPPPPANSKQPGVTKSLLYNGSKFQGFQKSKGNSYEVEVVLQVRILLPFLILDIRIL